MHPYNLIVLYPCSPCMESEYAYIDPINDSHFTEDNCDLKFAVNNSSKRILPDYGIGRCDSVVTNAGPTVFLPPGSTTIHLVFLDVCLIMFDVSYLDAYLLICLCVSCL